MTPGTRRGFIVLGGAVLVVAGLPRLWRRIAPAPQGRPHPTLAGFEMLGDGPVSGRIDPFAGIPDPEADRIAAAPVPDVCAALFRDAGVTGAVPAAFFTDINCPYCREMEGWLNDLPPERIAVTWHDLPLLGDASVAAARAVGAAALQGAAPQMRARLHRSRFSPEPAYLRTLGVSLGLDTERLLADMQGDVVEARIAESLGLSQLLALPGTPALVVGGSVAIGRRSPEDLARMEARARDGSAPRPCA